MPNIVLGRGILQVAREVQAGTKTAVKAEDLPKKETCEGVSGPCGEPGEWRRQNSAFCDDRMNWWFLCEGCQEEANEYYDDLWSNVEH